MSEEVIEEVVEEDKFFAIMNPQDEILLESGAVVKVFPVGYKQLKKFSKEFSAALGMLNSLQVPAELMDSEDGADKAMQIYMKSAIPYVITNLMEVVEDTLTITPCEGMEGEFTLEDVPHWELPIILHSWIMKSFGEKKKLSPWVAVVEDLMGRFTGKKAGFMEKLNKMFQK